MEKRGRGRPRKNDQEKKAIAVRFLCDPIFKLKLDYLILKRMTSFSELMRGLMLDEFKKEGI